MQTPNGRVERGINVPDTCSYESDWVFSSFKESDPFSRILHMDVGFIIIHVHVFAEGSYVR